MAKFTTVKLNIKDKLETFSIHYTQKEGFYIKDFPDEISTMTGFRFSHYQEEEKLNNAIYEGLLKYHEMIKTKKKVIAYTFVMTADLGMHKTSEDCYRGFKTWVPQIFQSHSLRSESSGRGFSINWKILLEMSSDKVRYYSVNEEGKAGRKVNVSNWQKVDWTPEREQAFRGIDNSMEMLAMRIVKILGSKKELLEMIDNKMKLLS